MFTVPCLFYLKRHLAYRPPVGGDPLHAPTGATISSHIRSEHRRPLTRGYGMIRRSPPRKVTYFEPVPPRLAVAEG